MQKVSNALMVLVCLFFSTAYAQTQGNTTLNQAIEAARVRKRIELNLNASAMANLPTTPAPLPQVAVETKTQPKPKVKTIPQLWSIQGLSNALRAEVVYEGRIYELSLVDDNLRAGDWILVGLNDQEAEMAYLESSDNRPYSKAEVIRLHLPANALTASEMFPKANALGLPTTGAPLPADIAPPDVIANAKSSMKLPSALNLLKP